MSSGHGIAGMLRCARPNHAHAAVRRYGDAHLSEHERDRPRGAERQESRDGFAVFTLGVPGDRDPGRDRDPDFDRGKA